MPPGRRAHRLAGKSEGFRRQRQRVQLTGDQLRAALPKDAALIDLLEYNHHAFTAQGKGLPKVERRVIDAPAADRSGRLPPYYWAAFVLSGAWQ